MTEQDAVTELTAMCDALTDPVIPVDDLVDILNANKIRDSLGYRPTDAAYTITYDLNRAASRAWALKMGKVASRYTFGKGRGKLFNRSDVFTHCKEMAAYYRSLINGSARVPGNLSSVYGVTGIDPDA